jgi:NTE family protein
MGLGATMTQVPAKRHAMPQKPLSPILALGLVLVAGSLDGTLAGQTAEQESTITSTEAAAPVQARRPRIGLALGGGSARGFAHIGVLEWFEAHHIPIDVIAGTSMGGLIAGAYATGMTPAEVRELIKSADWDLMFIADSPYKYKTIRRKQDKREFPAQLEFGLKGGFRLPSGLNPGQQIALLLDRIALPYYDLPNFDALPTPFRCVATDLRKGEAIVLDKGQLAQALRATMAIPGVFTPVTIDEWLLVDGGVLDNVPAEVVRKMGADIVIAVNVGADPATDKGTVSLFALLGRTIDTMMATGTRKSLESATLVIDPDLKGLNSMDWRRSGDMADRGFQAAEALGPKLDAYAISAEEHAVFQATRQSKRRSVVATPTFMTFGAIGEPLSPRLETDLRRALKPVLGQPIDTATMADEILRATGTDRYEYLTYRLTNEPQPTGLNIGVRQKEYGPPFLMLGLELNNVDSSNFAFNITSRVLQYDLALNGSETRVDVALGTQQRLAGEFLVPLGSPKFFIAPGGYFDRRGRNFYLDDVFVAEYRFKRTGAGLDLGYDMGRVAEIRLGYDIADVNGGRRIGSPSLPDVEGTEAFAHLSFTFDGQTSPIVPTRGLRVQSRLRQYFSAPTATGPINGVVPPSPQDFTAGEVRWSWFKSIRGGDRIFLQGGVGTSFGDDPLVDDFSLGGPLRLGAFNNDQLTGDNYLLLVGGYLRRVGRLPDVLGSSILAGGWVEGGSAFDAWDANKDWKSDVTVGILVESLLGLFFVGGSIGFKGGGRFYISLGPFFK